MVMCPHCQGRKIVKEVLPWWKIPFRMALYYPCPDCNGTGLVEKGAETPQIYKEIEMNGVFRRDGFFWEECPYAIWVMFSVMKCLIIWYLPLLLAMFVNVVYIAFMNKDGEAEKKIKEYWQSIKTNSGCGNIEMAIGAQLLFLIGVAMVVSSVMLGGVGSDHFDGDSFWFFVILIGGLALVGSQALMVGAFVEYNPPVVKKEKVAEIKVV